MSDVDFSPKTIVRVGILAEHEHYPYVQKCTSILDASFSG